MGEDERESKGTKRGRREVSLERLFGPDDKKLHIQCEGDLQKATPEGFLGKAWHAQIDPLSQDPLFFMVQNGINKLSQGGTRWPGLCITSLVKHSWLFPWAGA